MNPCARPENISARYLHPNGQTTVSGARPTAEVVKEIPAWVFVVAAAGLALLTYVALTLMINWRATSLEHLIR